MKFLDNMVVVGDAGWLDTALGSGKNDVHLLGHISDGLRQTYDTYQRIVSDILTRPEPSDFVQSRELLVDFYEKPPAVLSRLLHTRRHCHELTECPYCGHPLAPDTLDHFIPKDSWPEYSIFPNNLVPQCKYCAPLKGSNYFCSDENAVKYIHPYFNDLLSRISISIEIVFDIESLKPTFEVKFQSLGALSETELQQVKRHLKNLDVKNRIADYCEKRFNFWRNKLKARSFDIVVSLEQRLSEKAGPADFFGDWESALYKGMLGSAVLLGYLKAIVPLVKDQEQTLALNNL